MAAKRIDITGQRFNSLTVLSEYRVNESRHTEWLCRCDCGNLIWVSISVLKSGSTKACGCKKGEHHKGNTYDLSNDYGVGYTSGGNSFLFDKGDYAIIKKYTWSLSDQGYIQASVPGSKNKIRMHTLLLGCHANLVIDHKNRCKSDNRRSNLRLCTKSHNGINRDNQKGYCFRPYMNKFEVHISVNGKCRYIGLYSTEEEARKKYEEAIVKFYGEDWIPRTEIGPSGHKLR